MSAGAQALTTWYVHKDSELREIRKEKSIVGKSLEVLVHAMQDSFERAQKLIAASEYAISKLCGLQRMLHCYWIKIAVILKKLEKVKFDINKRFLVCNK